MNEIRINDHVFYLPSKWEDIIDNSKYLAFIKVLISEQPDAVKHLQLFSIYSGFHPDKLGLTESGIAQLGDQLVMNVFPLFNFLYDPSVIFVKNPIPSFVHDGVEYVGPVAKLSNQTGFQWEKTHHLQVRYDKSQDPLLLEEMIYTNYHAESRPAIRTPLPPDLVYGISLWYGKCEKWWSSQFPWLFPSDGPTEMPGFKLAPTGREVKDMLFKLSGSKLNADWDVVRSRSRQEIIYALDELEKERERIESQRTQ